jgi:hypothetical protein
MVEPMTSAQLALGAPKSILWLSLKALLAIEKLVNFCLLPSGSFTVSLP